MIFLELSIRKEAKEGRSLVFNLPGVRLCNQRYKDLILYAVKQLFIYKSNYSYFSAILSRVNFT